MNPDSPQAVPGIPAPQRIELIAPLGKALRHTGKVLFEPFDMGKWFVIGFCAWLATLGKGGGPSFGYNFNSNSFRQGSREAPTVRPIASLDRSARGRGIHPWPDPVPVVSLA